jgi:hypothetical protein
VFQSTALFTWNKIKEKHFRSTYMTSKFVGITIPKKLCDFIEQKRADLPRSYVYKRTIQCGLNSEEFERIQKSWEEMK